MKMKKLIATLGLTAALIGIAGQASAATESFAGVSVNNIYQSACHACDDVLPVVVKNDNSYPVTVTITPQQTNGYSEPEQIRYVSPYDSTYPWLASKTFTLQPEEKISWSTTAKQYFYGEYMNYKVDILTHGYTEKRYRMYSTKTLMQVIKY